jgi:MFS transporter, SP family, sugar:H+ symporter
MSRSPSRPVGNANVTGIEAPVSFRSYVICAFASFGGILFGYDSGYISGVLGMVRHGLPGERKVSS